MTKPSEEESAAPVVVDHLARAKGFLVDVDSTETTPQTFGDYARAAIAHALVAIAERLPAAPTTTTVFQRIAAPAAVDDDERITGRPAEDHPPGRRRDT